MKKRLVMLLAGLLTVLSMGFGLAQFSDVPAGHWAKEAVEALAAKGILVGFPDGTYRGNETLTRYQAALIIYRLLQQIEEEMKAKGESPTMEAMSSEDIEALKNAVQELAAELAALGVRVSALEDSAATKEDIARLEAMIQELKAQPAPEPGMDAAALQDLADRVEAASIAADTALAQAQQLAEQLDALAQDVEGVKGDLAALQTQVEANAQAIQALNELAVLLNQDVLSLQDRVTALEKGLADLQGIDFEQFASKEDVAAVQEFAAALRSDLVGLSEKVSKLEGTVGDLSGKVSKLERNAFTISGSLSLNYSVYRAWGADATAAGGPNTFDIDRLFSSRFSTGDGNGNGSVGDEADLGKNAEGQTTATLDINFTTGKLDAVSDPGKLNTYPGLLQFSLRATLNNPGVYDPNTGLPNYPINLTVDAFCSTLAVAKDQSLSFRFGRSAKASFSQYVFDNDYNNRGHGFVAIYNPGILGASITGVYGSKGGATIPPDYTYFRGARLALNPAEGIALGVSAAQEGQDANQGTTTPTPSVPTTVYGVDGSVKLGPIGLAGEYFSSDAAANAKGYYVKANAALGPISVEGNYRNIGAGVTGANMLSGDATSTLDQGGWGGTDSDGNVINGAPFRSNRQGFGVSASTSFGPLAVKGYYDSSTVLAAESITNSYGSFSYSASDQLTAYGGQADLKFAAFTLSGFYRVAQLNGATRRFILTEKPADAVYASEYGARLSHDGASKEAFIPKLSVTAAYTQKFDNSTNGFTTSDIAVYSTYELGLGPITLKPLLRYHVQDAAAASSSSDYTTFKYGVAASIGLDLPFKPSLTGEYYARTTQVTSANGGISVLGTISETKYGVGLKLGEFLFKNSSAEVKYASYRGSNLNAPILLGTADVASSPSYDYLYNSATSSAGSNQGSITGWYFSWTYWDLTFAYVEADVDNNGNSTHGQAFKISYKVTF